MNEKPYVAHLRAQTANEAQVRHVATTLSGHQLERLVRAAEGVLASEVKRAELHRGGQGLVVRCVVVEVKETVR